MDFRHTMPEGAKRPRASACYAAKRNSPKTGTIMRHNSASKIHILSSSVATIIAIHDISRYIHNIAIQKQCSSCRDIGLISADWCRRANLC